MIHTHLFQGEKRAVCVEKRFRCSMLARDVFMFVFAFSVTFTEKPWLSLSFKSISTPKQEPFIEDCYRRFFYMSACEQEISHSNLGNGTGTSRNLFLKHSSAKEKSSPPRLRHCNFKLQNAIKCCCFP
jgi:hypothetical protein